MHDVRTATKAPSTLSPVDCILEICCITSEQNWDTLELCVQKRKSVCVDAWEQEQNVEAINIFTNQTVVPICCCQPFWWAAVHTAILCQLFFFRCYTGGFPGGSSNKESTCQCRRCKRHGFNLWVGRSPWRRKWQPIPVSLPGKSHAQRSLTDYSLWGRKESDTTKRPGTSTRCYVRPDVNYSTRKILIYFIHLFIH